jgi:ABC-type multidrug transport system ATPase subunit
MGLARAVISDPPVVILDEPTANLDAERAKAFRVELASFLKETGKSAIIISHAFGDLDFADQVLVVADGKIIDRGTPQELLERPGFYRDGNAAALNSMAEKVGWKFVVGNDGKLEPRRLK